jgi:hypothetical protein
MDRQRVEGGWLLRVRACVRSRPNWSMSTAQPPGPAGHRGTSDSSCTSEGTCRRTRNKRGHRHWAADHVLTLVHYGMATFPDTPPPAAALRTYRFVGGLALARRKLTNREWLLAHLARSGPQPKRAVVAAWRRQCSGRPLNSLEVAFSRAKQLGLVTGEVLDFQGPSVWRLADPGEEPFIWSRWRGRPRSVRQVSVIRNGVYRPPWGSVRPSLANWAHGPPPTRTSAS